MKELFWLASFCLLIWVGALFISDEQSGSLQLAEVQKKAVASLTRVTDEVQSTVSAMKDTAAKKDVTPQTTAAQQSQEMQARTEETSLSPGDAEEEIVEEKIQSDLPVAAIQSSETVDVGDVAPEATGSYVDENRWDDFGRKAGERAVTALSQTNLSLGR